MMRSIMIWCTDRFLRRKRMWDKDSGRMYAHDIISWHKDEQITLEQAFELEKSLQKNGLVDSRL